MPWRLKSLKTPQLNEASLQQALARLAASDRPRHRRLWAYYRNPLRLQPGCPHRPYRQAQEWGLPSRITARHAGDDLFSGTPAGSIQRKEIVIENDIAWRVDSMVDYLFGKPIVIRSSAADPARRAILDRLIQAILSRNGGLLFFQQLALLGSVHGFVDVLVKLDPAARAAAAPTALPGQRLDEHTPHCPSLGRAPAAPPAPATTSGSSPTESRADRQDPLQPQAATAATEAKPGASPATDAPDPAHPQAPDATRDTGAETSPPEALIQHLARLIRLEIVEPSRAVPLLAAADYRIVDAYIQHYELPLPVSESEPETPRRGLWQRLLQSVARPLPGEVPVRGITEIITAHAWQKYSDGELTACGENSLGEIPLVHIQNTAMPFEYAGASEVEPLLPLQDELNTRLSDRANRIALQSFKMYLGRGIENFLEMPVAPGRMWSTDNQEASVQEFGGDANAPSEIQHIADIREAMDKSSGVSPIAAGAIKNRIGRLTSAAALRITLISLLAKTDKKRTTYGAGIARMIELSLRWLDLLRVFPTTPDERAVEIHWPSPLPENEAEKLAEAESKLRLGIPRDTVLAELGY